MFSSAWLLELGYGLKESVGRSVGRSMSQSVGAIEIRCEQYGIWLGPHLESLGAD